MPWRGCLLRIADDAKSSALIFIKWSEAMISSSAPTRIELAHPHSFIESCDVCDLLPAVCARVIGPRNQALDRPALDLDVDVRTERFF